MCVESTHSSDTGQVFCAIIMLGGENTTGLFSLMAVGGVDWGKYPATQSCLQGCPAVSVEAHSMLIVSRLAAALMCFGQMRSNVKCALIRYDVTLQASLQKFATLSHSNNQARPFLVHGIAYTGPTHS
jgi:hypothetical protein